MGEKLGELPPKSFQTLMYRKRLNQQRMDTIWVNKKCRVMTYGLTTLHFVSSQSQELGKSAIKCQRHQCLQ